MRWFVVTPGQASVCFLGTMVSTQSKTTKTLQCVSLKEFFDNSVPTTCTIRGLQERMLYPQHKRQCRQFFRILGCSHKDGVKLLFSCNFEGGKTLIWVF